VSYLGRKLDHLPKWEVRLAGDEVGASAITNDLRTQDNRLSFWEFSDAAAVPVELALAIASARDSAERCVTAWIEREALAGAGIQLESSSGNTPVKDLKERHVEAIGLDGSRLLVIADSIARAVRSTGHFRLFTRSEVIGILARGVTEKRLTLESLNAGLRTAVEANLAGS